jgi:hypothetical protein
MERIRKEAVVVYSLTVLCWHLSGGTEKNVRKLQQGQPITDSRLEPRTY